MFKGKKGKFGRSSPSRVNYAMGFFVDIDKYKKADDDGHLEFVNVMSLQGDQARTSVSDLKAISDTDATESVCESDQHGKDVGLLRGAGLPCGS